MPGRYIFPRISANYLNLSGGTVSGNTYFSVNLSAATIYSGSTDISNLFARIGETGGGTFTGGSVNNLFASGSTTGSSGYFTSLTGVTIYSGSTDLSNLFARLVHTHEISDVNNLSNRLNTKADLSGATFTGGISGVSISSTTFYSGSTDLSSLFAPFGDYVAKIGDTMTGMLTVNDGGGAYSEVGSGNISARGTSPIYGTLSTTQLEFRDSGIPHGYIFRFDSINRQIVSLKTNGGSKYLTFPDPTTTDPFEFNGSRINYASDYSSTYNDRSLADWGTIKTYFIKKSGDTFTGAVTGPSFSGSSITGDTITISGGSSSAPSLNFIGHPYTGLYKVTDGIGISFSGMGLTIKSPFTGSSRGHLSIDFPDGGDSTRKNGIDFGFNITHANYTYSFGDTITHTGDYGIGFGGSQTVGYVAQAFGFNINASGAFSIAVGNEVATTGQESFGLGQYVSATQEDAIVIGSGLNSSNRLTNNITDSLMIGHQSTVPAIFIGPGTVGVSGKIGLGNVTSPTARVDILGGDSNTVPFRIRKSSADKAAASLVEGEFQFKTSGRIGFSPVSGTEQEIAYLSDLVSGTSAVYLPLSGGTLTGGISGTSISAATFYSGSTNLSNLFARLVHTHEISDVNNLSNRLNTKADLSGATFTGGVSGTSISAATFYSGATELSSVLNGSYFKLGGNSFGSTAYLGLNDSNTLNIGINGTNKVILGSAGDINLEGDGIYLTESGSGNGIWLSSDNSGGGIWLRNYTDNQINLEGRNTVGTLRSKFVIGIQNSGNDAYAVYTDSSVTNKTGIRYASDYSATYTDRSLVDYGFTKSRLLPLSGGTITGDLTLNSGLTIHGSLIVYGQAFSAFTNDLQVEDNNITLNYNPTASTISASLGAGITIQDGSGISGTSVFFDIRGTSTGVSNRSFATNLEDIRIRESGTSSSPNGKRLIAEGDTLTGGEF